MNFVVNFFLVCLVSLSWLRQEHPVFYDSIQRQKMRRKKCQNSLTVLKLFSIYFLLPVQRNIHLCQLEQNAYFCSSIIVKIFSAFHLRWYLDTWNFNLHFLTKHFRKKLNFVGCFIISIQMLCINFFESWQVLCLQFLKTTICLFHPVNNDCIVRKRKYNNFIIES